MFVLSNRSLIGLSLSDVSVSSRMLIWFILLVFVLCRFIAIHDVHHSRGGGQWERGGIGNQRSHRQNLLRPTLGGATECHAGNRQLHGQSPPIVSNLCCLEHYMYLLKLFMYKKFLWMLNDSKMLWWIFYSFLWMCFGSPESLRWPIAMGWRPSSCIVRRASCVNIFFSRTTGPILTKFDM